MDIRPLLAAGGILKLGASARRYGRQPEALGINALSAGIGNNFKQLRS